MTDKPLTWHSFTQSLPSGNAYNHEFRVCDWLLHCLAYNIQESSASKLLNSLQGLAIIIAVVVFVIDLENRQEERDARREERDARQEEHVARKLTAVSNAYLILQEMVDKMSLGKSAPHRTRLQMVAIEELHKYAQLDGGQYLAGLVVPEIPFSLPRPHFDSGCHSKTDPKRVVLKEAYLVGAILDNARFEMADFERAHLDLASLNAIRLDYACLREAGLQSARLRGASLINANLAGANLSYSSLEGADLRWANLQYAKFEDTNMSNADLSNANISGASFLRAEGLTAAQIARACIPPKKEPPKHLPGSITGPTVRESC